MKYEKGKDDSNGRLQKKEQEPEKDELLFIRHFSRFWEESKATATSIFQMVSKQAPGTSGGNSVQFQHSVESVVSQVLSRLIAES
jgi:hypothetical protein